MKFISKNANLRIVLEPGIQGNVLAGQLGKPGVYVKFQDGVVEIKDQDKIDKMKLHDGYNIDFISVDEKELDPYAHTRSEIEPPHIQAEIRYGHVDTIAIPKIKGKLSPQMKKILSEQAMIMAKQMVEQMLPDAVEQTIKALADKHKDDKKAEDVSSEVKEEVTA